MLHWLHKFQIFIDRNLDTFRCLIVNYIILETPINEGRGQAGAETRSKYCRYRSERGSGVSADSNVFPACCTSAEVDISSRLYREVVKDRFVTVVTLWNERRTEVKHVASRSTAGNETLTSLAGRPVSITPRRARRGWEGETGDDENFSNSVGSLFLSQAVRFLSCHLVPPSVSLDHIPNGISVNGENPSNRRRSRTVPA